MGRKIYHLVSKDAWSNTAIKQTCAIGILSLVLVLLAGMLIAQRVEQLLQDTAQSRNILLAQSLRKDIETGLTVGLLPKDQMHLPQLMRTARARESSLVGAATLDESLSLLAVNSDVDIATQVRPSWNQQLLANGEGRALTLVRTNGDRSFIGTGALDSAGKVAALVWLVIDLGEFRIVGWQVWRFITPWCLLAGMVLATVWTWGSRQGMFRRGYRAWRTWTICIMLSMASLVMVGIKAHHFASPRLNQQIDLSAHRLAEALAEQIDRALSLGIPLSRLEGLDETFAATLDSAPEAVYVALVDPQGIDVIRKLAQGVASDTVTEEDLIATAAVTRANGYSVTVGIPHSFVTRQLSTIAFDLILAIVVALVLTREIFGGWLASQWSASYRTSTSDTRQSDIGIKTLLRIRLIVFLTALSDEMLRPFFVTFASDMSPLAAGWSPTLVASLPVLSFMFMLAVAQPVGPWLLARFTLRQAIIAICSLGAILMTITAFSDSSLWLIVIRGGSGFTYGLLLIVCQAGIVDATRSINRASGLAMFTTAIVAAGVCGPVLGGMLADRLGYSTTFILVAFTFLMNLIVIGSLDPSIGKNHDATPSQLEWRGFIAVFHQPKAMAVIWFSAIPARLAAAALLVVLTPLMLQDLRELPSMAGRVLMLYFVAFLVIAPWVARRSDARGGRKAWVLGGGGLSVLSCVVVTLLPDVTGIAICCLALGVAQAMASSPQLALMTEVFEQMPRNQRFQATPAQALAAFRLIERVGSIAAPLFVVAAVARFGLHGTYSAIAVVLLSCTLLLALVLSRQKYSLANGEHITPSSV